MKHIFIIIALFVFPIVSKADADHIVSKSNNQTTEFLLDNQPIMTIGDIITISDGVTKKEYNANQRIVLTRKPTPYFNISAESVDFVYMYSCMNYTTTVTVFPHNLADNDSISVVGSSSGYVSIVGKDTNPINGAITYKLNVFRPLAEDTWVRENDSIKFVLGNETKTFYLYWYTGSTVDAILPGISPYTFYYADQEMAEGSVTSDGALFFLNGLPLVTDNGSFDINGTQYQNSWLLNGSEKTFCFKLAEDAKITVYGKADYPHVFAAGTTNGDCDIAKGDLSSGKFVFKGKAGQVIHFTGINDFDNTGADVWIAGFTIEESVSEDLNDDGKFNMKDVQLAFDIYMELKDGELPDFNEDGKQNMKDVQYLFDKYMEE